jgi:hypothetical protein
MEQTGFGHGSFLKSAAMDGRFLILAIKDDRTNNSKVRPRMAAF